MLNDGARVLHIHEFTVTKYERKTLATALCTVMHSNNHQQTLCKTQTNEQNRMEVMKRQRHSGDQLIAHTRCFAAAYELHVVHVTLPRHLQSHVAHVLLPHKPTHG